MSAKITTRQAESDAERAAVYHLRYQVYVEQQGLFADVADHDNRWLRDALDDEAMLLMTEHEGALIGTARLVWGQGFTAALRETFDIERFTDIVSEADMSVASRFLVLPQYRQSPVSAQLFFGITEALVERGNELMFGECEPHLLNTWGRLGVRAFGVSEHPTNGMLVRFALLPGDIEHAREIDSPLLPIFEKRSKQSFAPRRLAARLTSMQRVVGQARDRDRFWAQVEKTIAIDALAKKLGGLEPGEFDALLGNSVAIECEPGSRLIRKGHVSRTLYILLSGSLEVWDGEEKIVTVDQPGEVMGEVAFFSGATRMSDVMTGPEGALVLALSDRSLQELIGTHGSGAAKFLLTITRGLCNKLHQRAR